MKICLLEPFHGGSHAIWGEEYARHSGHQVELLTLPGRHWKWRMHGGAATLARRFLKLDLQPDLLLASDMLDLPTFLALTRQKTADLPVAVYFHENQLSYPWSPEDADPAQRRDAHYAFINYTSALAADAVLFNSAYHRKDFLHQLPDFLKGFPDCNELSSVERIEAKSQVLPLGLDLERLDQHHPQDEPKPGPPLILWNHRWEYDKNPDDFFAALYKLQDQGLAFEVAILGESYRKTPPVFAEAQRRLGNRIIQFGYAESFAEYARWLWRADLLPVTSNHDFFGASVVQAIYCGCTPLLPDRLAYPEHLPYEMRDSFLYRDGEELLEKLLRALLEPNPVPPQLATHVARYGWDHLAGEYDRRLEALTGHQH